MPLRHNKNRLKGLNVDISNEKQRDFDALLERARSGDQTAVGQLLNDFRKYLLLIANKDIDPKLKGKLGSSDIVQESMLTAHQHFASFQGKSQPELMAWLRQILVNDLNQNRRRFVGTQKRQVDRERPIQANSEYKYSLVDPMQTPKTTAVSEEENLFAETMPFRITPRLSKGHSTS